MLSNVKSEKNKKPVSIEIKINVVTYVYRNCIIKRLKIYNKTADAFSNIYIFPHTILLVPTKQYYVQEVITSPCVERSHTF